MEESEDNMSSEDISCEAGTSFVKVKPKKRSLVERELETNLTARVTSPVAVRAATSTSRYGRARRFKTEPDSSEKPLKSPRIEKSPNTLTSPVYKMHASNSPIRIETPKKPELENQIETIYNENNALSRFGSDEKSKSVRKYPKVYIRKDLIQSKEKDDDTIMLIKNMFSPNSSNKSKNSAEKYKVKQSLNGLTSSVVKTLDFDGNKKKKVEKKTVLAKNELFEIEAKCEYQVGDLAWARMGTYPFWPCIVTRDPLTGMYLKKKLYGRIERDVIHVTFCGDNGRRGWIVDSMLRKFVGQLEFETTKTNFTSEAKKKDPRLYAAYFVSDAKMPQWQTSVDEAEALLREPKRFRIDILSDMLEKNRTLKTTPKHEKSKKVARTNSDVSLSESLYDTLFSEDDSKVNDTERSRSKSKNRSLDVSEVVTACLDNMAAKTGITKIQRQSHMDRWLQKAKSKTPEKSHLKSQIKRERNDKLKKNLPRETKKPYSFRSSSQDSLESVIRLKSHQNEHDYSQKFYDRNSPIILDDVEIEYENAEIFTTDIIEPGSGLGIISKVETLHGKEKLNEDKDMILTVVNDEIFISEAHTENEICIQLNNVNDSEVCNHIDVTNVDNITELENDKIAPNYVTDIEIKNCVFKNRTIINVDESVNKRCMDVHESGSNVTIEDQRNNYDLVLFNNKDIVFNDNETTKNTQNVDKEMMDSANISNENFIRDINDKKNNYQIRDDKEEKENNSLCYSSNIELDIAQTELYEEVSRETLFTRTITDKENTEKKDNKHKMNGEKNETFFKTIITNIDNNNDNVNDEKRLDHKVQKNDLEAIHKELLGNDYNKPNIEPKITNINYENDKVDSSNKNKVNDHIDITLQENVCDSVDNELLEVSSKEPLLDKSVTNSTNYSKENKNIANNIDKEIFDVINCDRFSNDVIEENISKNVDNSPEIRNVQPVSIQNSELLENCFFELGPVESNAKKKINYTKPFNIIGNDSTMIKSSKIIHKYKLSLNKPAEKINGNNEKDKYNDNFNDITSIDQTIENSLIIINSCYEDSLTGSTEVGSVLRPHSVNSIEPIPENDTESIDSESIDSETDFIEISNKADLNNKSIEIAEQVPLENSTTPLVLNKDKHTENNIDICAVRNEYISIIAIDPMRSDTPTVLTNGCYEDDNIPSNYNIESVSVSKISSDNGHINVNGFYDNTLDFDTISIDNDEPLSEYQSRIKSIKFKKVSGKIPVIKKEFDKKKILDEPEFLKYLELRQDALIDERPELTQEEIVNYLYKTWLYEEGLKSDNKKADDIDNANLVKGLNTDKTQIKKIRKNIKVKKEKQKEQNLDKKAIFVEKPKRRIKRPYYKEDFSYTAFNSMRALPTRKDIPAVMTNGYHNGDKIPQIDNKENESISEIPIKKEVMTENCYYEDNLDPDKTSINDSNESLLANQLRLESNQTNRNDEKVLLLEKFVIQSDNVSIKSEDSEESIDRKRHKDKLFDKKQVSDDTEFLKYLELRQDALIDENPDITQEEITHYLYKTWLYEESLKSDTKKADDIDNANLVKGLNTDQTQMKKIRKKVSVDKEKEKEIDLKKDIVSKEKSKRKIIRPYYREDFSDFEDDVEYFEIFKPKQKMPKSVASLGVIKVERNENEIATVLQIEYGEEYVSEEIDQVEEYFRQLTAVKPNLFKGLMREKVCEICEKVGNLVKCKGCHWMFHIDCIRKETKVVEVSIPIRGRKKKKKNRGRKAKEDCLDSGSQSDDKDPNVSEELQNLSTEDDESHITVNADDFENKMVAKMQEILQDSEKIFNDSLSNDENDWNDIGFGECKIVDIKQRKKEQDYSDFKCNNCQKYDLPICFVCKSAVSPKDKAEHRQKCLVAHCNQYYHMECLDHWPQTQFNGGELSRTRKGNECFEAFSCPRHVCHTCVCDDPRGCKTRFSGDKLARCVRCPATYHTFTKCLPAGTQILSGSHIICPRHYEHRPGKVPCHVNTGWCFICALGGSLICCEYCPTSFHAECLNISPPEGGYMCEDCETGRLPLYGEMVWVKLGHYRWWPGIILHPSEIPLNILAVKHSMGEFVVRFFGQYDYYWVNRGRVFPFQEGDSGKVSSQKSKIDAAFGMAMEHAQRACDVLKNAIPNEEESLDIAQSLLPPHYVKLKVNKPIGSLSGRKVDVEESSLTQCECDPNDVDPCGPYTQCLNRMLLTECGPTCRAGDRCNNRAFEKRLYPKMVPYRTPQRGWGLRTLEEIKAGQFVIEYVGELIDVEEFQRRMRRKHEVRDENFYFLTLDKERVIDAGPKGNSARFMNHSCEPNCETQKWTVLGDIRVGLFALYDIPANSELTFNYNLESAGIEKKQCMCGAKRCSGYIGAKPKQEDQPKKPKRTYKKRKNIDDSPSTSQKPKNRIGRPYKSRELTEIEKDLLIIKNATNSISSDSECSRLSIDSTKDMKNLKRKKIFGDETLSKKIKIENEIKMASEFKLASEIEMATN